MADPLRIVVLGALGQMPFAGIAWQVLHYLEGFRRLGHDVTYVEDTGNWPYDPELETVTDDASAAVRRLGGLLAAFGFGDCWAYFNAAHPGELHGMRKAELVARMSRADVLVNLSGGTVLGPAHQRVPVRIYLETDPVTPQIEIDEGRGFTAELLAAHTHHFTFGERIGTPECVVPVGPFQYLPTRQPVVLDWWAPTNGNGNGRHIANGNANGNPNGIGNATGSRHGRHNANGNGNAGGNVNGSRNGTGRANLNGGPARPRLRCTTVASWEQGHKDIRWRGETYTWSKSAEFEKLLGVPARVDATLELALALDDEVTLARLRGAGYVVGPARGLSNDPRAYRDYIRRSGAEFTAAKDQNVRLRSGWFSDRTATYLASGRPAVVQDTGFDDVLPTGEGLLSFRTPDEAVAALQEIAADPVRHGKAALAIAREHFDAEVVLAKLLRDAGL